MYVIRLHYWSCCAVCCFNANPLTVPLFFYTDTADPSPSLYSFFPFPSQKLHIVLQAQALFIFLLRSLLFFAAFIVLPTQNPISLAFLHSSYTRKFYAFNLPLRASYAHWRCIQPEDFLANLFHLRNSSGALFSCHCFCLDLRRSLLHLVPATLLLLQVMALFAVYAQPGSRRQRKKKHLSRTSYT